MGNNASAVHSAGYVASMVISNSPMVERVVKTVIRTVNEQVDKRLNNTITVASTDHRTVRALTEEVKERNLHTQMPIVTARDGRGKPEYEMTDNTEYTVCNATYVDDNNKETNIGAVTIIKRTTGVTLKSNKIPLINHCVNDTLAAFMKKTVFSYKVSHIKDILCSRFVEHTKNVMRLLMRPQTNLGLRKYLEYSYSKHNAPHRVSLKYISQGEGWSAPRYERPRDFTNAPISNDMRYVLDDVDDFMNSESQYAKQGKPYKRGYLLFGKPGTGKTLCSEIIADKYNMPIYQIALNATRMNDSILVNLFSSVPPNSLILIDEIDDQLETLRQNTSAFLSIGGILSAIDGPQRLSNRTIVILTSNNGSFMPPDKMASLCRPGRIDQVCVFQSVL